MNLHASRDEYWVFKVLMHQGTWKPVKQEHLTLAEQNVLAVQVERGALLVLPDGCIAEPVEVFHKAEDAHELRKKLMRDNTNADYRVIFNSDVAI